VYARRVKDRVLDFSHRGWLYEESFVFYDYETDSLWVQATGTAVAGPYQGTSLDRLPATQTTWTQWRTRHPETLVLGRAGSRTADYWHDSYELNYRTGKGIKYDRHAPVHFGLGVILPGARKLYPFQELEKNPVLADRVGEQPIVVVFHARSRTAVAFDPRLKGRLLDFEKVELSDERFTIRDRQTLSTWSALTGLCLSGPSKRARLRQLTTTQFVVENWPLHYPQAPVYSAQ
jgi:Protein of unknown function (DUF3179)